MDYDEDEKSECDAILIGRSRSIIAKLRIFTDTLKPPTETPNLRVHSRGSPKLIVQNQTPNHNFADVDFHRSTKCGWRSSSHSAEPSRTLKVGIEKETKERELLLRPRLCFPLESDDHDSCISNTQTRSLPRVVPILLETTKLVAVCVP
ncbi:hypothetical protein YC2023_106071 [Brassica napus]